jgi:ribosomal protein S4
MARHQVLLCDICGRPTERIVGKLSYVPSIRGTVRLNWSNYTHTADVGDCCQAKLFNQVKFRKRMTREQYLEHRRQKRTKSTARASLKNGDSNGS